MIPTSMNNPPRPLRRHHTALSAHLCLTTQPSAPSFSHTVQTSSLPPSQFPLLFPLLISSPLPLRTTSPVHKLPLAPASLFPSLPRTMRPLLTLLIVWHCLFFPLLLWMPLLHGSMHVFHESDWRFFSFALKVQPHTLFIVLYVLLSASSMPRASFLSQ